MKIAIVGAGGVGGYFGARLAAAGNEVTFVARGKHLEAMRSNGLRIASGLGDIVLETPNVVGSISEAAPVDLVIVAVKLWDTEAVAQSLVPLVDRGASVISFQNGVQKDEILAQHLPPASIMGGVCYIAADISAPGLITHNGTLQKLTFGEYTGTVTPRVNAFHDACDSAGITVEVSDHINRAIWEKFVFLVGLSGTTTSMRKPVGSIRENPKTREFLRQVMIEVVKIGRARGADLPEDYADHCLAFCDTIPAQMIASMHHDLERGNRLELPWLSGWVAQMGAYLEIPTPKNTAIAEILELYTAGSR
jgi:2-dehydropantoate 2-reductase